MGSLLLLKRRDRSVMVSELFPCPKQPSPPTAPCIAEATFAPWSCLSNSGRSRKFHWVHVGTERRYLKAAQQAVGDRRPSSTLPPAVRWSYGARSCPVGVSADARILKRPQAAAQREALDRYRPGLFRRAAPKHGSVLPYVCAGYVPRSRSRADPGLPPDGSVSTVSFGLRDE